MHFEVCTQTQRSYMMHARCCRYCAICVFSHAQCCEPDETVTHTQNTLPSLSIPLLRLIEFLLFMAVL